LKKFFLILYIKSAFHGDWGLGIGDLGVGVLGQSPKPQTPTPIPQPPKFK